MEPGSTAPTAPPATAARPAASDPLVVWIFLICLAAGALGVLSGYCIFLLWQEKAEQAYGWLFVGVLAVAALTSFVLEYFRDVIKHGRLESLNVPRVLVTVVTLMMFELFIFAWEGLPEMNREQWQEIPTRLLGPALAGTGHAWLNLVVLAGLWVVAGMTLCCTLGLSIGADEQAPLKQQIARGGTRGVIAGAVVAPLGTIAFILLVRVVLAGHAFIFEHAAWKEGLRGLAEAPTDPSKTGIASFARMAFELFVWIDDLFHKGWWGALLGVAIVIAIVTFIARSKFNYISAVLIFAVLCLIFGPVLADLGTLLMIPILAAVVWCVPGVLLGMAAPLLRRPSERSREWGIIALVAAVVLVLITRSRFQHWYLLPAGLMIIAVIYFRRGVAVEDYWPVVALSVGVIVCGVMWIVQKATFAGVLDRVHQLNSLPAYMPPPEPPPWQPLLNHRWPTPLAPDWRLHLPPHDPLGVLSPITHPTAADLLVQPPPPGGLWPMTRPTVAQPPFGPQHLPDLSLPSTPAPAFHPAPDASPRGLWPATRPTSPQPLFGSQHLLDPTPAPALGGQPAPDAPLEDWVRRYIKEDPKLQPPAGGAETADSEAKQEEKKQSAARCLELSLAGSLGFWATVALLATWSLRRGGSGAHAE